MKAFLCHSSKDSAFVLEVAKHLKRNLDGIFCYEEYQSDESFMVTINRELQECEVLVAFAGAQLSKYQRDEANTAYVISQKTQRSLFTVLLQREDFPPDLNMLRAYPCLTATELTDEEAFRIAKEIILRLGRLWRSDDDLPLNPHLFDYEKDIIGHFCDRTRLGDQISAIESQLGQLEEDSPLYRQLQEEYYRLQEEYEQIRKKQLDGCPPAWPEVVRWTDDQKDNLLKPETVGEFRPEDAKVVAAGLSSYHRTWGATGETGEACGACMLRANLCFPEAGPRAKLFYPRSNQRPLNVAVLVSGGIAPGINAVIDGIAQRHSMYASRHEYQVQIYGFENGFQAFDDLAGSSRRLSAEETSRHANEGGSILGTSRFEKLINIETRREELEDIVRELFRWRGGIDILYVIGGDGSMKAAHAIWSFAREYAKERQLQKNMSVVAIPKTMDNDILWVWQTFGFLSAVEKAREVIEHLATEVQSNPRLCIIQLFGSDSGFVVSHAVLASRTGICDAALIPEADFSMKKLATDLKEKMCQRGGHIPYGFVVLGETAIPIDAMDYVDDPDIDLSEREKAAVQDFQAKKNAKERIQGQTDDALRTAGLKIVSRGLYKLLPDPGIRVKHAVQPDWRKLRVFTNEPRHLLRAIPPSCSDIITAQRLGILAVDNALAGYTDFMISQWLTEYVLVPLKLVVLGRKRIPQSGIFWKSVRAKTGQTF